MNRFAEWPKFQLARVEICDPSFRHGTVFRITIYPYSPAIVLGGGDERGADPGKRV
jgi:hypothetical protein